MDTAGGLPAASTPEPACATGDISGGGGLVGAGFGPAAAADLGGANWLAGACQVSSIGVVGATGMAWLEGKQGQDRWLELQQKGVTTFLLDCLFWLPVQV